MKEIQVDLITEKIAEMVVTANKILPDDVVAAIKKSADTETDELPRGIMADVVENIDCAQRLDIPICQDTGMAVVFLDVGQDVHIVGGGLTDAVNRGVAKGYTEGRLRLSVAADPLRRVNTNNNTPAVIHTSIVPGDELHITVAPKGFGSENMSRIKMMNPSASADDVVAFVTETVRFAGGNPCPPVVVGVGIGGDFEKCALLAKKALCRPISEPNPDEYYAGLERRMLEEVNRLNIGPQGFGGKTTALGVNIEVFATHIAGLPVAVNMGCHVNRHVFATL